VTIKVFMPAAVAWVASVAIRSSASNPDTDTCLDLEGVEHLADQLDLGPELVGGLGPARLYSS